MLFEIYIVVLIWFKPARKKSCTYLGNVTFLLYHTFFFLQALQRFFHIAVNLWKRSFCKCGRWGLHFEFRASDCGK